MNKIQLNSKIDKRIKECKKIRDILFIYRCLIQDIYWNKKYGFSTENGIEEGQNKVYAVLEKAKLDKRIPLFDFLDFYNELHQEGII